ncbi:MAG: hypothetical protein ACYCVD_15690 [Desulfitobacteriaceae bacterium]
MVKAKKGIKSKSEAAKKERTPSFVCETPVRVTRANEKILNACFESARQMYNDLLGEAMRRLTLMRQSKLYSAAKAIPATDEARYEERIALFKHPNCLWLLGVRFVPLRN